MEFFGYLQSYDKYFWQWEDNAEVMAIPSGSTIAYEKFTLEIVKHLVPQGLPPFGSLLLAIIATNPNHDDSFAIIKNRIANALSITDSKNITTLDEAISFLKLLSTLPKQYKQGKKRILVYQAIFEGCHNIVALKNSQRVYDYYTRLNHSRGNLMVKKEFNQAVFLRDFRTIGLLAFKFKTVKDIIDKVARLPEIPDDEIELEEIDTDEKIPDDFIEQLIHNTKTFQVGSLVKRIWGGLNIPVHSVLPSQQPLGGISDLTNKGDFDKLLISEFANDDIVFLSRLANNEALYIQREIPPANNKLQRTILIDASLKNWGTPKAIAFAITVAIAKHPKTDIECNALVIGNHYHAISVDSVDNIIDSLQILEGSLHCANGLAAYFKDFPHHNDREVFLITTPSTLKQVAMLKAINDYHTAVKYWIYTDAEGGIDVYKKQQNSKKHLQRIQLPLAEIWQKNKKTTLEKTDENNFSGYPILLKHSTLSKQFLKTDNGEIFQITEDRCLLKFYNPSLRPAEKGWELVYRNLPFSTGGFEIGLMENGDYILLMFNPQTKEITLLNIYTGTKRSFYFKDWPAPKLNDFLFFEHTFYYSLFQNGYWKIGIDGTIERNEQDKNLLAAPYRLREKELSDIAKKHSASHHLLKNINGVVINNSRNLAFNSHELILNQGHHIKLQNSRIGNAIAEAVKSAENEFTFTDGSSIKINRSGVLVLKSSNHNIPPIYIPSVLDASLGLAIKDVFAGNDFYYKEGRFEVMLTSSGSSKINVVKILKEVLNVDLREAKNLVDSTSSQVITTTTKTKAQEIKKLLEAQGASVELTNQNNNEGEEDFTRIPTDLFMTRYIQPFIDHIISNGTKNKTASQK